ncbi:MAG: hypothetical protein CSA58_05145 [Micrococcales bacterium]|nr:MAG: hypothetical protein CSB46_03605 [Micrococcales bacterium]PIE27283.1 MAG: hypothetical protein CSA58_05145 [Micrococcales bacterium]
MTHDAALQVRDLVVGHPREETPILDRVSLHADRGRLTALLGPNGAGKTTTLECCVGLRTPSAGDVVVLGRDGARLRTPEHRSEVGVMLQDGGLPVAAKPLALLNHLSALYADPWPVSDLVDRLGLGGIAGTAIRHLSGGERQRVALAAAIVGRPWLAFLDEPTAGMDVHARLAVNDMITGLVEQGVAVLLTTHDIAQAEELAAHVVIIDRGTVVAAGSPRQLVAGRRALIDLVLDEPLDTATLALPPDTRLVMTQPGHYQVDGDVGPYSMVAVARWLAKNGVVPRDLRMHERTLQDVFVELTGRAIR